MELDLSVSLPVTLIFDAPTVGRLAAAVYAVLLNDARFRLKGNDDDVNGNGGDGGSWSQSSGAGGTTLGPAAGRAWQILLSTSSVACYILVSFFKC